MPIDVIRDESSVLVRSNKRQSADDMFAYSSSLISGPIISCHPEIIVQVIAVCDAAQLCRDVHLVRANVICDLVHRPAYFNDNATLPNSATAAGTNPISRFSVQYSPSSSDRAILV